MSGNEKRYFSLIETVISLVILALVMGGTFVMFYQGFLYSKKSKELLIATNLIREELERLTATNSWPPIGYSRQTLPSPFEGFERAVEVSWDIDGDEVDDYPNELARITVKVWRKGESKELLVGESLKANY